MTATEPTTDLVPLVRGVLANPRASFADVLDKLGEQPTFVPPATVKPVLPKAVHPSTDQVAALDLLVTLLDGQRWPTVRRELRRTEIEDFNLLLDALGRAKTLITDAHTHARTALLNHRDVRAEQLGLVTAETPRDKDGHYLVRDDRLDDLYVVPEQPETTKVTVKAPAVSLSERAIFALVDDEGAFDDQGNQVALTRKDYLAVTTPVRVTDDKKVLEQVSENPNLAPLLAKAAVSKGGSLAITRGKNES